MPGDSLPISSQMRARTFIRMHPLCLGDADTFQDHMAIMFHWSVLALCRELVWLQHSGLHICIQKSGIRLGLVHFSFKEVRSYFMKVSGVFETCGCGRSGLESEVETQ